MTVQAKATEQDFLVVLFAMLCKVVLTFEYVIEFLENSDGSYCAALSCGAVYYALQGGSNLFEYVTEILKCDHLDKS